MTRFEALTGKFQSTLPTRGSDPYEDGIRLIDIEISIHAPHEGERRFAEARRTR